MTNLPIPEIAVPIWDWQLGGAAVSTGLIVSPRVGSSKITADWHARLGNECSERGQLVYTMPEAPASFGPNNPCFVTADKDIEMQLDE